MSKFGIVLRKTGAVAAATAMLLTMGAGVVTTQAKTSVPYTVTVAKKYTNTQSEKQMSAKVTIPKITVTGADGEVLKTQSDKLNAAIARYQNAFIKSYKKDAAAIEEGQKGNESLTSKYQVVTDNDTLFTLRIDTVIAMGGSQSYVKLFNVDKKTGKMLTLKDLFTDGSDYRTRIYENIRKQMQKQMKDDETVSYFLDEGADGFNRKSISSKTNFYINAKGQLTLVFDKYEVAPGSMGIVEFSVPTSVVADIAADGYLK